MPTVRTALGQHYADSKAYQSYARGDLFEVPDKMSVGDFFLTLPGSALIRTASRVVAALSLGEGHKLLQIAPESISMAIESFLETLRGKDSQKGVSITRVWDGGAYMTHIDISPLELARRIGIPIRKEGYFSEEQEYIQDDHLELLYKHLDSIPGWIITTMRSDGKRRIQIRFSKKNF